MRAKTLILILIAVLLTMFIMQNSQVTGFTVFFTKANLSTQTVLATVAVLSFVVGTSVGTKRKKQPQVNGDDDYTNLDEKPSSGLSDEDKDYIN